MPCVWGLPDMRRRGQGYIAMERSRRNVREARSLYKRCHSRRLQDGGQAAICVAWLRFEREEGRCLLCSACRTSISCSPVQRDVRTPPSEASRMSGEAVGCVVVYACI